MKGVKRTGWSGASRSTNPSTVRVRRGMGSMSEGMSMRHSIDDSGALIALASVAFWLRRYWTRGICCFGVRRLSVDRTVSYSASGMSSGLREGVPSA